MNTQMEFIMTTSEKREGIDGFKININLEKYKPYLKDHKAQTQYFLSVIHFLDEELNKQNAKWKPEEGNDPSDIELSWVAPYLQETLYGVLDSYKKLVSYKYNQEV